ncbi:MAG: hypothetical protein J5535_03905 [Firmicutes bacterium]|nr:hypothetical protein [Bacillota bacterium]MBR5731455.1 hypothetical protein [Bacillota bacterium]
MDILLYVGVALFTVTIIVHRFIKPLPQKVAFGLYVLAAILIVSGMALGKNGKMV